MGWCCILVGGSDYELPTASESIRGGVMVGEGLKIDFAICRTGFGKGGLDPTFIQNVNGAHDAGLICGAYHYSYALTPSDAIIEAQFCKRIIEESGLLLELPVWFDMEDEDDFKGYMWQFTDSFWIGDKHFDGNILYK